MDCGLPGSSVHGTFWAFLESGLTLPSPGYLPDPGIEPVPPALAGEFFITEPPGKPQQLCTWTAKETQMYRTVFWTLWEREVGDDLG